MADGGGEVIIEDAKAAGAAPVRPIRRSGLAMNKGPLAPEATPEQLGGAPDETVASPSPAEGAPARPTRRSGLSMNSGPLAPEATPEQLDDTQAPTGEATAPAESSIDTASMADQDLKAAIDPPAMPTGADGAAKLPDGYASSEGPDVSEPSDADHTEVPSANADLAEESTTASMAAHVDPMPHFEPQDDLHQSIMTSLLAVRNQKRQELLQERDLLERQRLEAIKEYQFLLSRQGAGGGGGGIGSALMSLGRSNPVTEVRRRIGGIDAKILHNDRYRATVVDGHYASLADSADQMYKAHKRLSSGIADFNSVFSGSGDGGRYLSDVESAASARGVDQRAIRDMIHDTRCQDADVVDLRKRAEGFLANPAVKAHIEGLEAQSRRFEAYSAKVSKDIRVAARRGLEMHRLDGEFTSALGEMKADDCALAKPGGERLDNMSERMKETAKAIAESIKKLVDSIIGMFRRS